MRVYILIDVTVLVVNIIELKHRESATVFENAQFASKSIVLGADSLRIKNAMSLSVAANMSFEMHKENAIVVSGKVNISTISEE